MSFTIFFPVDLGVFGHCTVVHPSPSLVPAPRGSGGSPGTGSFGGSGGDVGRKTPCFPVPAVLRPPAAPQAGTQAMSAVAAVGKMPSQTPFLIIFLCLFGGGNYLAAKSTAGHCPCPVGADLAPGPRVVPHCRQGLQP